MHNPWENPIKYGIVGLIWLGVFILAVLLISSGTLSGAGMGWFMGAGAFLAAGMATGVLFQWGQIDTSRNLQIPPQTTGKQKNEQHGIDPLSLLTDEDVEELRRDVKDSLRRRLLQSEDGELNGLDSLLADQERRQRR